MQLKEASAQNLEVTNMVDFKSKIKSQKAKDRERAGKKSKTLKAHNVPSAPKARLPSSRQSSDNSAAIMKGVTDLFKDKDAWMKDEIILDIGDVDPGIFGAYDMPGMAGGYKKGGRLKNAGKRKRAALRGQRSELRGS